MDVIGNPMYMWNHRVHQQWADEDLTFWRLAFFPHFREEKVVESIKEVLEGEEVHSYAIYQTLGHFDLFIRSWIPSQSHEAVEQALNQVLQTEDLETLESFIVNRILRHHVWDDDDGVLREPDTDSLLRRLDDVEIDAVNELRLPADRKVQLENENLLAELPRNSGIKFLTIITPAAFFTTSPARQRLERDLLRVLGESRVKEPSLYQGSGFGNFLIIGRAAPDDFYAIPQLANEVNALGIDETLVARPYTYICSSEETCCAERLPTTHPAKDIDVEELLEQPESHHLEVKGSLRLDWQRWLFSPKEEELCDSEAVLNDGVIRTVVGMLNADGGKLVIGGLERDRVGDHDGEIVARLQGYERVGDYVIVGIDDEERFKAKAWDGFRLQLQDMLSSRIDPSPAGLVSFFHSEVGGRTMCVISVQPSGTTWFYRRLGNDTPPKFYVREDGRTVAYEGAEADRFKRARSRG